MSAAHLGGISRSTPPSLEEKPSPDKMSTAGWSPPAAVLCAEAGLVPVLSYRALSLPPSTAFHIFVIRAINQARCPGLEPIPGGVGV